MSQEEQAAGDQGAASLGIEDRSTCVNVDLVTVGLRTYPVNISEETPNDATCWYLPTTDPGGRNADGDHIVMRADCRS